MGRSSPIPQERPPPEGANDPTLGGIRRKLLRAFGLLLFLFGAAALVVLVRNEVRGAQQSLARTEKRIQGAIDEKGRSLAMGHAVAFRILVADNAVSDMRRLLQITVENDPDVQYGAYISVDGELWAFAREDGQFNPRDVLAQLALTPTELASHELRKRHMAPFGRDVIEYSVPVFDQDELAGTLRYGVSTEGTTRELVSAEQAHEARVRRAVLQLAGIVLLILVGTLILAARTAARIAEPVTRLTEAVKRLARGDRSVRVNIQSEDELESLGAAFNTMASDLDVSYGDLEEANRRLKAEIEERRRAQDERSRLERHLLQAQKMEAIGQLAGGVAHDFNNILMAISGSADMLELQALPDEASGDIAHIHEAVGRGANLTRQLLMFSRRQEEHAKLVDPNEVVVGLNKMVRRLLPERIEFEVTLGEHVPHVFIDPGRLEQVVLNLVVNARDAVGDKGWIRVMTSVTDIREETSVATGLVTPGRYLDIEVVDDGCGIDETTLSRVFEPFFTTKGPGKGTGLGLATAHGIISQAGGYIDVKTCPSKGTAFRVLLPAATGAETAPAEVPREVREPVGSGEMVLLCEDDPVVRRLVQRILESHGYRVIGAERPSKLLSQLAGMKSPARLLVTDVIMPELNGKELAGEVRKHVPDLKVLYISGHPGKVLAEQGISGREEDLLPKPFTSSDLLARAAKLLS